MSTTEASNNTARVQELLLLVWVHGFVGDESTFADFPEAAQNRFKSHDVHSIFYPTYKTVGELDVATEAFVVWLHQYVLDLETEQVDKTDRDVHTTVILLGHSMGGMLVADAAKMVHDQHKKDPDKEKADVRGVIAIDTPFIGIHPALVSYGMEQIDAYIDKTLLDTAAFFENSPRFLKNGMARIGITTDKPKSSSPGDSPDPGRLTKGFTSVLALPSKVSSAEWDWTSESRGGGWKGVRRVISGQRAVVEVDEEMEERLIREKKEKREKKDREKEEKRIKKELEKREKKEREAKEKEEKRLKEEEENREKEEREAREKKEKEEREAKEKQEKEEREERERREKLSDEERKKEDEERAAKEEEETQKAKEVKMDTAQAKEDTGKSTTDKEAPPLEEKLVKPSPESTKPALIPPPLPPRRITSKSDIKSPTPSKDPEISETTTDPSTTDLALTLTNSSMADPNTLVDQSSAAKQAQQKKNWKWVKSHMQFMSSCWSVGEISRRMKGIDMMQKEGMYFVNVYTIVKPDPPLHPKDRTFVSLPTIHHPTKDSWKPFIHDSAADQVEAHMALFDKEKHKGYGRLIGVICDEVEEVLKRSDKK